MASVVLGAADLALFSNLSNRVKIPVLMSSQPSVKYEATTVRFVGDTSPTPFRGEGTDRTWNLTARYGVDSQADMVKLLDLIELANNSADQRLFLRTHIAQVAGLDTATAVVVHNVDPLPQFGRYYDVSFTAVAVQFSLAV